jgi:integrase
LAGFNPPEGGKEITKAFATEEEADLWLAEQFVSIGKGSFIHPDGPKTLLGDYWQYRIKQWESHLDPSTIETYRRHWNNHIGPAFGRREMGSFKRGEFQAWVNHLPVANSTKRTVLAILQSLLKAAAVVDELIPKSPAVGVKSPPVPRRKLIIPTAEEVYAIADAIHPPYKVAVIIGAETGAREGEILGMRVEDLALPWRKLTISRQAQTVNGKILLDLPPKSDAGYREVPLAPETVDAINLHLKTHRARGGLVVTTSSGAPVRRGTFNDAWNKAKIKAGIENTALRFHDLRHRYASVLIEAGLDPLTVKTLMGHASITETYDTYGKMFESQSERAAQAIAASIHAVSRTNSRTKTSEGAGQTG